jgi:hypothetical protein
MADIKNLAELYEFGKVTEEWPDQWAGSMPAVSPCRIWHRSTAANGYAHLAWSGAGHYKNGKVKLVQAHLLAYRLRYGSFPVNQGAHLCAKRACVNPDHIQDKTQKENELDKRAHGTALYDQRLSSLPQVFWNWKKHGSGRRSGYWRGQAWVNGQHFQVAVSVAKHGDKEAQRIAFERLAQKLIANGIANHEAVKLYLDGSYLEILNSKPAFELAA